MQVFWFLLSNHSVSMAPRWQNEARHTYTQYTRGHILGYVTKSIFA